MNEDAVKLALLFKENTKTKKVDGRFCIDCRLGLWGVSASTKAEAEREAMHYFVQYLSDGEYDQPMKGAEDEGEVSGLR